MIHVCPDIACGMGISPLAYVAVGEGKTPSRRPPRRATFSHTF